MKNSDRFQIIYESTRALGLVNTQHALRRLCARKANRFSASKHVARNLTLAALITLIKAPSVFLQNPSSQSIQQKQATDLDKLSSSNIDASESRTTIEL